MTRIIMLKLEQTCK